MCMSFYNIYCVNPLSCKNNYIFLEIEIIFALKYRYHDCNIVKTWKFIIEIENTSVYDHVVIFHFHSLIMW